MHKLGSSINLNQIRRLVSRRFVIFLPHRSYSRFIGVESLVEQRVIDPRSTGVMESASGDFVQPAKFFEESLKTTQALERGEGWQEGMSPLKVLCLHGGGANNKVMEYQTRDMRRLLGGKAEFHFAQGTHKWPEHKNDPAVVALFGDGPYFGWMDAVIDPDKNATTEMPWGKAMRDDSVWITYKYRDEALQTLCDKIDTEGPFDVIMGFSQGSIVITMLTALYLKKHGKCPWKYNVQFAGFPVRDSGFRAEYMQEKLSHPTLLVYGRADPFFEWGITMQKQFEAPLILEHGENHRIPKDQGVIKRICEEMLLHCPTTKL